MNDEAGARQLDFRRLTADIVAAYVSNNHVQVAELPILLARVYAAVRTASEGGIAAAAETSIEKPSAAEIRRSVGRDALTSFEDGKPYKTLKRHLTGRGLTPERYREKWGLPRDYPMVAPDYAERRSALAKSIGLGRPGAGSGAAREADESGHAAEPRGRNRKKTA